MKIITFLFLTCLSALAISKPYQLQKPEPEAVMPFGIAYSHIRQFYVKTPEDEKLFRGAIKGMLEELDPHSTYFDEEALKQFKMGTDGNFVGVGIVLSMDHKTLQVMSVIKDSPAAKAHIQSGDYILAVNDKSTLKKNIEEAAKMIRGKPNTKVTLTLVNMKDKTPRKVTLVREKINIDNVSSKLLNNHFAYIQVVQFQNNTADDVKKAYQSLAKKAKIKGVILDLRNNPGGLLEEAVKLTDLFLDAKTIGKDKTIVFTKERDDKIGMRENAKTADMTNGLPIVVLINKGSASASEIVSGALQDYKRALVVGTKSFGKGSVQTLLPIDEKTAIKLTTALYYTPKGRSIQATGIEPDILVEELDLATKKKDKKDEVLAFLTQMREKDLDNSFKNGKKGAQKEKKKEEKILEKDFQLHEALNIAQALSLIQQKP